MRASALFFCEDFDMKFLNNLSNVLVSNHNIFGMIYFTESFYRKAKYLLNFKSKESTILFVYILNDFNNSLKNSIFKYVDSFYILDDL